ncbi:MAG: hypothetical protein NVS2B7_36170 [Herpetosiphon sp.]
MNATMNTLQALPWTMAGQVVLAAVLGVIIGMEREWFGHPAGIRTNGLVAVGSCVFTLLSIIGFPVHGATQDTGRVAAQIVSGIGFLGAGVVLHTKDRVVGVTTAATIWLVAAVGMAVGAGLLFLAAFTTLFCTAFLLVLRPISERLERRARAMRSRAELESDQ